MVAGPRPDLLQPPSGTEVTPSGAAGGRRGGDFLPGGDGEVLSWL